MIAASASSAFAQDGTDAESAEQAADSASNEEADNLDSAARSLFLAGREAYSAGRFEEALDRFKQAYELSNRVELLYNIGQSLDRLRRDEEAIEAFEAFLEANPPEAQRTHVETRLEALRRAQAVEPAAVAQADPDEPDPYVEQPPEESTGPRWGLIAAIIGAVVVVGLAVAIPLALIDTEPDYVSGNVGGVHFTLGSS